MALKLVSFRSDVHVSFTGYLISPSDDEQEQTASSSLLVGFEGPSMTAGSSM